MSGTPSTRVLRSSSTRGDTVTKLDPFLLTSTSSLSPANLQVKQTKKKAQSRPKRTEAAAAAVVFPPPPPPPSPLLAAASSSFRMREEEEEQQQPSLSTTLSARPGSAWMTGMFADPHAYHQRALLQVPQKRRTKNEWLTPLLPTLSSCSACVTASVCPCIWVYCSANTLLNESQSHMTIERDDGCPECYAGLLSALICAPALFCIDRSATHTLNGMMDRSHLVPPHAGDHHHHGENSRYDHDNNNDDNQSTNSQDDTDTTTTTGALLNDAWMRLLQATGFGTHSRERGHNWTDDGKGFDIEDWSEDYWAAGWCSYYSYHSFCCNFLRCRTCNNAPYAPMCFVLLCGGLYPLCLCPSALLLRRSVISSRNISETCFDSMARSLFCTPCSLVQTYSEIRLSSPSAQNADANTTTTTTSTGSIINMM
jgi:hypothetical protein